MQRLALASLIIAVAAVAAGCTEEDADRLATEVARAGETAVASSGTALAGKIGTEAAKAGTAVAEELEKRLPPWLRARLRDCPEIATGVRHCTGADYELVVADLSGTAAGIHVVTAHDWIDPEVPLAQTVLEMASDPAVRPDCNVVAGINGGLFGPGRHNSEGWTVAGGVPRRDMKAKVRVEPDYVPRLWPSFVIREADGLAEIGHDLWHGTVAREAVTAGPVFHRAGETVGGGTAICTDRLLPEFYCTDAFSQSVVAVNEKGDLVYLLTTQPRRLLDLDDVLGRDRLNVWTALKLDGRSSAQMIYLSGDHLESYVPQGGGGAVSDAILVCSD